jgi:hypothetical protein
MLVSLPQLSLHGVAVALIGPNMQTTREKKEFSVTRRRRWFGYAG